MTDGRGGQADVAMASGPCNAKGQLVRLAFHGRFETWQPREAAVRRAVAVAQKIVVVCAFARHSSESWNPVPSCGTKSPIPAVDEHPAG
jgi:hypothetical protein